MAAAVGLVLGVGGATPAIAAAAAPKWDVTSLSSPTWFIRHTPEGGAAEDHYLVEVTNVGDASQVGELTIADVLPPGLGVDHVRLITVPRALGFDSGHSINEGEFCTQTPPLQCSYPGASGRPPLAPEHSLEMVLDVTPHAAATPTLLNEVTVSGGGAPSVSLTSTNPLGSADAPFGFQRFAVSARDPGGAAETQAGGHPYEVTTTLNLNTAESIGGAGKFGETIPPVQDPKDLVVDFPPGLLGNPQAVPTAEQCLLASFAAQQPCPVDSQIGTIILSATESSGLFPLYDMKPRFGVAAEFGFSEAHGVPVTFESGLLPGRYTVRTTSAKIPPISISGLSVTLWGVPADPRHDPMRGYRCKGLGEECDSSGGLSSGLVEPRPFLTLPSDCSSPELTFPASSDPWQNPGVFQGASSSIPAVQGCNQVPFTPTIAAEPTTNHADSPSGLDVDLHLPQHEACSPGPPLACPLASAHLKDATVTLPAGLDVNPSSAAGLQGCSEAQIGISPAGLADGEPAACPDASKLGSVEVNTPLLDHPLPGSVYLAKPHENPSGSLIALYIAIDDPVSGTIVKLPGKVTPDPVTGQLRTTVEGNPQVPFEDFKFKFFPGALAPLRTPSTCGSYETTTSLTPWSAPESGPPATPHDEFQITGSASGSGACPASPAAQENAPRFHAGTENTQAGAFSPFSLKLVREDGSQELKQIDTTLPPGLVGKLAGVGECSEAQLAAAADPHHTGKAEQAAPSCPPNTGVGSVDVGAGAGPTPLNVPGKAYLAGPYKSAPLSLAIITPAVAGPFDLGTVLVRTALYVNPETAQIHAVSDEIPHILEGIPLDVRSITLKMARPNFTLNPTNCEELHFAGSILSVLNVSAPLSQRFQVGGCSVLPFKPKLSLKLKGAVKRTSNPKLIATLTMKPGGANVASAQVTLPPSAFLDNAHIGTVCTRVQFAAGTQLGEGCPPGSVYGRAKAISPLLDKPLEGNVYLRSSSNKLPDLVAALNGQIEVALDGKTDSVKGALRNTFEAVPDAPVSSFRLELFGGKRGLIQMSSGFCAHPEASVKFTGQNGKAIETNPKVKAACPKKKGKGHHKHRRGHR